MYRLIIAFGFVFFAAYATAEEASGDVSVTTETDRIPLLTVTPDYPKKARRDRIEAEVQVCFDVDRNGKTRRVAVRRSTHRAFERAAIRAVKASTFRALGPDQQLQAIKSCRTFVFALRSAESN